MFRGSHQAKVNGAGRLKLPTAFKDLLDAQQVTRVYVTSQDGKFAEIWPMPEWEKWEAQLARNSMKPSFKKYLSRTSFYGQELEIDSQARIVLPQMLREDAQLNADVAVVGNANRLEVHNKLLFKQSMDANPFTEDENNEIAAMQNSQV